MPDATPNRALPFPEGTDVPDVPLWLEALAVALDQDLGGIETMPRPAAGTKFRVHRDTGTGIYSLDTGAGWVTLPTGGPFMPSAGGAFTGAVDLTGHELAGAIMVEDRSKVTTIAAAGANRTLDAAVSPLFDVTLDQNVTFTFSGVDGDAIRLVLRQPAAVKTVAWPANVDWPGTVPAQVALAVVEYLFVRVASRWLAHPVPPPRDWTPYVPVITANVANPNLGSTGHAVGQFQRLPGRVIVGEFEFLFNGAGIDNGSGFYGVSLPVPAAAPLATGGSMTTIIGEGLARDNPAGFYPVLLELDALATQINMRRTTDWSLITDVAPFVPAAADNFVGSFRYRAAG